MSSLLTSRVHNDWEGTVTEPVVIFVLKVLKEMESKNKSHAFGIGDIKNSMKRQNELIPDHVEVEIGKALNYFADRHFGLIDVVYFLHDRSGINEIRPDDLVEAAEFGDLVHPITGEAVTDYEKNVSISFRISKRYLNKASNA